MKPTHRCKHICNSLKPMLKPKIAKELPPPRPKIEFQTNFSNAKKIKPPYLQTNTTKKNDTKTQQRQWFTDLVDKNASTQQAFGSMAGSVVN